VRTLRGAEVKPLTHSGEIDDTPLPESLSEDVRMTQDDGLGSPYPEGVLPVDKGSGVPIPSQRVKISDVIDCYISIFSFSLFL